MYSPWGKQTMKILLNQCLIIVLLLPLSSLACESECNSTLIGKRYLILNSLLVHMEDLSSRHESIALKADDEYLIEYINENRCSYVVTLGDYKANYLCSSMRTDEKFSYVIQKDVYDEAKLSIGKTIYTVNSFVDFYKGPDYEELYKPEGWRDATIESLIKGTKSRLSRSELFYSVRYSSGGQAYISLFDYNWAVSQGHIVYKGDDIAKAKEKHEEDLRARDEKERAEKEKLKNDIITMLEKHDIYKGKTLWAKEELQRLPIYTKITVTDVMVSEQDFIGNRKIILNVNSYGKGVAELSYNYTVTRNLDNLISIIEKDFFKTEKEVIARKNTVAAEEKSAAEKRAAAKKRAETEAEKRKVYIGMSKDDVLKRWGKPENINRTVGSWGVHEQWVYGQTYLYFKNGIMTSFQD